MAIASTNARGKAYASDSSDDSSVNNSCCRAPRVDVKKMTDTKATLNYVNS